MPGPLRARAQDQVKESNMDKFLIAIFGAIAGTLFGSIAGGIVSLFFNETILTVLMALGIKGISLWQLGAFLGFVSDFFSRKS
jgi:hypothetical protein